MIKQFWKGLSAVLNALLDHEVELEDDEDDVPATTLERERQHTRDAVLSFIYDQWVDDYPDDGNTVLLLKWADMVRFLDPDLYQLLNALAAAEQVADRKFDMHAQVEKTCGPDSEVTAIADQELDAAMDETDACWAECDAYIRALEGE